METEQIFEISKEKTKKLFSFVQFRGSLPFIWEQIPDLKCVPRVKICSDLDKNTEAFEKHMKSLNSKYGRIIILNLIDRKRVQKKLGEYLEKIINKNNLMVFTL